MQVYIDLENLLKEKNISKNKVCEACKLQRTQLNNYCKNKVYSWLHRQKATQGAATWGEALNAVIGIITTISQKYRNWD